MGNRLKLEKLGALLIVLYFIALVLENLYAYKFISYTRYAITAICIIFVFVRSGFVLSKRLIGFLVLYTATSILNIVLVGNSSLNSIIFTIVYLCLYKILTYDSISERHLYWTTIICCTIVTIKILSVGVGNPILLELSNNFVSVLLLMPCIVYYIRSDFKNDNISLLPAALVWIACLLAQGRGGILASSVLLFGIAYMKLFIKKYLSPNNLRKIYIMTTLFSLGVIATILLTSYSSILLNSVVFQRFSKYGMYGTGRTAMWEEYINEFMASPKAALFGVSFDDLFHMIRYKNNIHNSFLNIHATNGLLMLLYVIVCIAVSLKSVIQNKKWITAVCIIVYFLRAFTDRIFWGGSSGTIVFFFLLWVDRLTLKST